MRWESNTQSCHSGGEGRLATFWQSSPGGRQQGKKTGDGPPSLSFEDGKFVNHLCLTVLPRSLSMERKQVPVLHHMSPHVQQHHTQHTQNIHNIHTTPPHSGELNHALSQFGGPTQFQLSSPMSSGHRISMEHRLRRKQLNSVANASNKTFLKERQEKRREETFFLRKKKKKEKEK